MFAKLSQWWMGLLYSIMGKWVVECLETPRARREIVMQHSEGDHGLIIFCEELYYEIQYRSWWIPNIRYTTYKFTAVCTGQSPDRMKQATEEPVVFPEMFTSVFNRSNSKKHMLNVFVKVIVYRMKDLIQSEDPVDSSTF